MSDNIVNVAEAKELLKSVIKTSVVPFLWGPPGVGKSSIVKQLAKELDYDIIDLRLSLLNPVDLRGLPIIDKKNHSAEWLKPSFLPTNETKRSGILFLDEINLAHQSVQAAAYQLILDKKLGEYTFPNHWKIVAAGNREIDKANVYKISAPLANRFIHLTITEDWKIWKDWALKTNIHKLIMEFIALHPTLFLTMPDSNQKAFPSPRSWEFVSEMMTAFGYIDKKASDGLQKIIVGTIGEAAGSQFLAFLENYDKDNIDEKIKEFYKTGKITMPDTIDTRFVIIKKVVADYQNRDIDNAKFMLFLSLLTSEEKALITSIEKQLLAKK